MERKIANYPLRYNDIFLWFEESSARFSHSLIVEKDWRWFIKKAKDLIDKRGDKPLSLKIPSELTFPDNILLIKNVMFETHNDIFWLWNLILYPRVIKKRVSTILISPIKLNLDFIVTPNENALDPLLFNTLKDKLEWCRRNFFRIIDKNYNFSCPNLPITDAEKLLFDHMSEIGLNPIPQYSVKNIHDNVKYDWRLDFAFEDKKVYVECDDASHLSNERKKQDTIRTKHLASFGWRGIRIKNSEIFADPRACAFKVRDFLTEIDINHINPYKNIPLPVLPSNIGHDKLDENQERAAMHLICPAIVIAGPGSGKTKTMVTRVAFLINSGINPESIVVITLPERQQMNLNRGLQNLSVIRRIKFIYLLFILFVCANC